MKKFLETLPSEIYKKLVLAKLKELYKNEYYYIKVQPYKIDSPLYILYGNDYGAWTAKFYEYKTFYHSPMLPKDLTARLLKLPKDE